MPLNLRTPGSDGSAGDAAAHTYPIARGFALVLLAALIILIILRHLFGSVSVNVGTR
jgi:hypothetical protein